MDKYLYWLANVSGLGTACRERLLEAFGTGAAVYGAQEKHLAMVLEKAKAEKNYCFYMIKYLTVK